MSDLFYEDTGDGMGHGCKDCGIGPCSCTEDSCDACTGCYLCIAEQAASDDEDA